MRRFLATLLIALTLGLGSGDAGSQMTLGVIAGGGFALDGLPTPAAAYSLRRLRSAYTANKAVNIRRASDSTATDIGFSGENFNSAAFNTFCAATTCFVTKWYDQSGLVNDVSETVASRQPQLVLNSQNGRPALSFVGASFQRLGNAAISPAFTASSVSLVVSLPAATTQFVFEATPAGVNNTAISLLVNTTWGARRLLQEATATYSSGFHQISAFYTASLGRILVDRVQGTDNVNAVALGTVNRILIGQANGDTLSMTGSIGEMIFFAPDLSAGNSATVAANQKAYWGTP